jgi:Transposase DDE domain
MSGEHLIVTVHGIRTFGQWQERLEGLVQRDSGGDEIDFVNYKFGYFSLIAFVVPLFRWLVVRRFRQELIHLCNLKPRTRIDLVGHSFGTHIIAWAIAGRCLVPSRHRLRHRPLDRCTARCCCTQGRHRRPRSTKGLRARSMATSGRGSGIVGYNVQVAVDTEHHLIITHEVTNVGSDRAQLARIAKQTKATLERTNLDVIADRGYFSSEEILECDNAGITVTLPKPTTSNPKRFGKQDFRYVADEDVYICPAGERLAYSFTTQEHGLVLRRYLTNVCQRCAIKHRCTTAKERRITRWEHEHILEAVQRRLDKHPEKMRQRRETVEHPFGTIKARMGATHFLTKTLPRVASEMALHVLAYNLTRVMNIMGIQPLMAAIRA